MTIRADALRSRERILAAARDHPRGGDVRLNDLAREAGVGVGTVYRHFPTQQALTEALSMGTLARMLAVARAALSEPEASVAFTGLVREALELQLSDGGLQAVLMSPDGESAEVRETKQEIYAAFSAVLQRAQAEKAVRPEVNVIDVQHLICGLEHSVRLGDEGSRDLYTAVILAGLRC